MAQACTVCTSGQRETIDRAIVAGEPNRRIAAQSSVTEQAIRRHKAEHLPVSLVRAKDHADVASAIDIVAQLKAINAASLAVLSDARRAGDGELALKAVDRVLRQIQLQAQLLGELAEQPTVSMMRVVVEVVDDRAS